jgi:hypothetical protein
MLIAVFDLGTDPIVEAVGVTRWARASNAAPYFAILSEETGWKMEYPGF